MNEESKFLGSHEVEVISDTDIKPEPLSKWKRSLYVFVVSVGLIFLTNTAFLIWAVTNCELNDGKGVSYEASCPKIRQGNIGIHLLVNVLGTLLLGASSYCIQCLSAPTRKELDKAHEKGGFLDVGIPSFHNIKSNVIGTRKKLLWLILAFSSLPLHLWYVE
jgi:hypothetical protein